MTEEELFCKLFPEYAVNGKPLSPYFDCFESGYEQSENRIEELEKENERLTVSYETLKLHDEEEIGMLKSEIAELKGIKDVATLIRANNDTVTTLMQLNNMLVSRNQQLTKATELLRKLVLEVKGYDTCEPVQEAEQFLNSEVEKC